MKITYNWIREFVDVKFSPEDLAEALTMAGLEVKAIEHRSGDAVFEIEITSNRADWLSVLGVAREVSAITGKPLRKNFGAARSIPAKGLTVALENRQDCPVYTATIISGVRVGPSPEWLEKRLELVGCRSVNNVVDITNYVLFELGEPLHAFDLDKLEPGAIVVRRAAAQEEFVAIDGQARKLDPDILVIADPGKAVAVAGVMGGKDTEVSDSTSNVLLEAAIFDPLVVRRGRQKLGMQTEASYRFERGIDPQIVAVAASRAAALIRELCGGTISGVSAAGKAAYAQKKIALSPDEVERTLGIKVPAARIKTILKSLGCSVKGADKFSVTAATHRPDLKTSVDLIEEVARIHGFSKAPATLARAVLQKQVKDNFSGISRLKDILVGLGLQEIITYSMIDRRSLEGFGFDLSSCVELEHPMSQEQEILRPTLLPGLARAIAYNLRQRHDYLAFFEIAKRYSLSSSGLDESYGLGLALCGGQQLWLGTGHVEDHPSFLHIKGILERLFDRLGFEAVYEFSPASGDVLISAKGKSLGVMKRLAASVLDRFEIKNKEVFSAELSVDAVLSCAARRQVFKEFSRYPAVVRDENIVVEEKCRLAQILEAVAQCAEPLLRRVWLRDCFRPRNIPPGKKKLTLAFEYGSAQRTLTDEQVNAAHSRIVEHLQKTLITQ